MKKFCLFIVILFLAGCGEKVQKFPLVPKGATVVALGDSLTAGVGTTEAGAYPTLLAQQTGWRVINGGVSGDTSAQGLARLPALLKQYAPQLVIVSLGGNDFLQRLPESETRHNLQAIIDEIRADGAQVLLLGIPQLSASALIGALHDHPMYAELAQQNHLQLYGQGWSKVLREKKWHSDQVHPNTAGYAEFTRHLVDFLRQSGRVAP